MGSSVSVTVANLVMEDVEDRVISSYHTPVPFWKKRYVDDICTAIPKDRVEEFHQHLNTLEPSTQFTYEVETEYQLLMFPF